MTIEESYDDLIKLFVSVDNKEDMKSLFNDLFTDAEVKDFTLRWKLMNDLIEGVPQRKIASDLKISLCKITRGSKMLKKNDGFVSKYLYGKVDETHR